jgi:hypothetical protein
MIRNIYKGWKTTIIGTILIGAALAYIFINATPDYILMSILLASGVAMLFFPDNLLQQLKTLIKSKSK